MGKRKSKSSITGQWQIVSMTEWDEDYLNEEVEAYFDFSKTTSARFSSATFRERLITNSPKGTGNPPSSFPGTVGMVLMAHR